MKTKITISAILLIFIFSLVLLNINVDNHKSNILSLDNIEALASEGGSGKTVYCCSPYTKTCIYGGPAQSDIMGEKKDTQCRK